jgi:hypothetical protein
MSNILVANQFTAVYDEKEDRVRLIININYPTRYDFWITRKFLIDIMDNLQTYLTNFKEEPIEENLENQPENNTEVSIFEPTNEPSLLETLNITKQDNFFILTLEDNKNIIQATFKLNELKNLLKMLLQPVRIRWGLGF